MGCKTNLTKGAIAGFMATLPMSAAMLLMRRWLPWWQQGPLPPHEVTSNTLDAAGLDDIDEHHHDTATLVSHFGYGAMSGTLYPLVNTLPMPTVMKSALYGFGIWAASYMGWLPAAGLFDPATKRPMQRNLLMIVAHLIWGAATGLFFNFAQKTKTPKKKGEDH